MPKAGKKIKSRAKKPRGAGKGEIKSSAAKEKKTVKPELPGGFRDFAPTEAAVKIRLLEKIRKTFESFGFEPMDTPIVEKTEVLRGGNGESEKILFDAASSQKTEYKEKNKLSLRFDLTVPLARFAAANPEIPKPFKRYQIGEVFRGESPQLGRYRQFTQADCDIVGSSRPEADAEIISVIYSFFKNLGFNKFVIGVNSRKVLDGLPAAAGFKQEKLAEVLRIIDKKNKIAADDFRDSLKRSVGERAAVKIQEFLGAEGTNLEKIAMAGNFFKGSPEAEKGTEELVSIAKNLDAAGIDRQNWKMDFSVVRGLGYYTGSVFEAELTIMPEIGSVFSGGRYDNLVSVFTGEKLPCVGASLGVDRLLAAFAKLGVVSKKPAGARVLVFNLSPELKKDCFLLAKTLREAGINAAFYLGDDSSFGAQLAYAAKKEIPFAVIYGPEEKAKGFFSVKNLIERKQTEVPKENIAQYFKNVFGQ